MEVVTGEEVFDYIIVGAGSAGCVLANRLSADPHVRVLLIEAGGTHRKWKVDMPLALDRLMGECKENWGFQTEPEPAIGGRTIDHPRGRLLGGSSSINGMVYTRGNVRDFDRWASLYGCTGWDYESVLPFFVRAETSVNKGGAYRGTEGPLFTQAPNPFKDDINRAFMNSGVEASYPYLSDSNGRLQEGFSSNEQTIYKGERWSTARAYLDPAKDRSNLVVRTECLVDKVHFDGSVAVAVRFSQQGRQCQAFASKEIILAAGAIGSPAILQRSGVGPEDVLRNANIVPVKILPVGEGLQDHPDIIMQFKCKKNLGLYKYANIFSQLCVGAQWFATKTGQAASNQFEASAYLKTDDTREYPNLKLEILPVAIKPGTFEPYKFPAFQIHMTLQRAKSRGRVAVKSQSPEDSPSLLFNYLENADDIKAFIDAVNLVRNLVKMPSFERIVESEIFPGPTVQQNDEIENWIRQNVATAYHPGGTCRMGRIEDDSTVVDSKLRVKGLLNLRVVDASVMPEIATGNLNAPTIMIAEKAASLFAG